MKKKKKKEKKRLLKEDPLALLSKVERGGTTATECFTEDAENILSVTGTLKCGRMLI